MFDLLAQTFNASLIALSQIFLSTVVSTNPWFERLDVQYQNVQQELVCSTKLADSFTQTLDNVLLSGQTITLHFRFDLFAEGSAEAAGVKEIVNGFRYDSTARVFYLINSEDRDVKKYFTLAEARSAYISIENLVLMGTENLATDTSYFLKVSAFLDPVKLEKTSESVNLMLRWASVKPTIVSDKFMLKAAWS